MDYWVRGDRIYQKLRQFLDAEITVCREEIILLAQVLGRGRRYCSHTLSNFDKQKESARVVSHASISKETLLVGRADLGSVTTFNRLQLSGLGLHLRLQVFDLELESVDLSLEVLLVLWLLVSVLLVLNVTNN